MSMLLQQAFQHLTLRWQRNCSVAFSFSMMGLTGLPANGESSIMSLNSASFISHYLPGTNPTFATHIRKHKVTRFRLDAEQAFGTLPWAGKKPGARRRPEFTAAPKD